MKKNKTRINVLVAAAVSGLFAGAALPALAMDGGSMRTGSGISLLGTEGDGKTGDKAACNGKDGCKAAKGDKDSCKGKEGCKATTKPGDKDSCKAKDSCKGKDGCGATKPAPKL